MQTRLPFLLLAAFALPGASQAHFMWASLSARPRNLTVRYQFGEFPDESIVPQFSGRASAVHGMIAEGKEIPLRAADDSLIGSSEEPFKLAGSTLEYGIVDRSAEGRGVFMLRYYAKAAADPESSMGKLGLPLELTSRVEPDGTLSVQLLKAGVPAVGADVAASIPGVAGTFSAKTGAEGRVKLPKIQGLGAVAVRAGIAEDAKGEFEGKPFSMVRSYTTLTLAAPGEAAPKADTEAYGVLERAMLAREMAPGDIIGITGNLAVESNGKTYRAPFDHSSGSPLSLETEGWPRAETIAVAETAEALLGGRTGFAFARMEGRNPITFGEANDANGRRILLHDLQKTAFLVKGDEVAEVERTVEGRRTVTAYREIVRTPAGKILPRRTETRLYDEKGELLRTTVFVDEYAVVAGVWLPKSRTTTVTEGGRAVTRKTRFENLKIERRTEG